MIGAFSDDGAGENAGAAYVFRYTAGPGGPFWVQEQKLIGSGVQAEDSFGISVSLIDEVVLIGSYERFSNGVGSG